MEFLWQYISKFIFYRFYTLTVVNLSQCVYYSIFLEEAIMIEITFSDGIIKKYEKGISIEEIVKSLGMKFYKTVFAAKVNGEIRDLRDKLDSNCEIQLLTFDDREGQAVFWHTTSHILAQAVMQLFPDAKLAIGPAISNGFYYDIDFATNIGQTELTKIEQCMKEIIKQNLSINRYFLGANEALTRMADRGQNYKLELIKDLNNDNSVLSFYSNGDSFEDLCIGPHLLSTGYIKAVKLLSCTGAYWRGDSKNKMLTRIYGISFPKASLLDKYLNDLEEAQKRDHNKIGRELGYFTSVDCIGQGLPVMLEKGSKTLQIMQRFVEDEEEKRGYILTKTPLLAKREFYKISGHWDHYRENMFVIGDPDDESKECLALRPMTCPFQFQLYLNKSRSYRDLPMRFSETSTLFRNEASGEMHGLIRLRQFTISEGHIVCTADQLTDEFKKCVELANFMLSSLGLQEDVFYRFSKWDEKNKSKYIGDPDIWNNVQNRMKQILDDIGLKYEEIEGDAAFYGPKLDIQIKNVYGKEDTLVTVQIDFQLSERFGMTYTDENGNKQFPYVLHRTSLGCYERTLALLLEKYAGALPLWLMSEQVRILPISSKYLDKANELKDKLLNFNIRTKIDDRNEKIGYKIRSAQIEKIPYMLILGEKEFDNGTISVRSRKGGDLGSMSIEEFIKNISNEIKSKNNEI